MDYNTFIKETTYKLIHGAKSNYNMDYTKTVLKVLGYVITSIKTEQFANKLLTNSKYTSLTDEEVLTNTKLAENILTIFGCLILPSQLANKITEDYPDSIYRFFSEIKFADETENFFISDGLATNFKEEEVDKFAKNTLTKIAGILYEIDYSKAERNILGEIYNYFLSQYGLYDKNAHGDWVHEGMLDLYTRLLTSNKKYASVYEASGKAGQMIAKLGTNADVYTQEKNSTLYNISMLNMIANNISLHRLHKSNTDTITQPKWEIKADIAVANPPFGVTLDNVDEATISSDERFKDMDKILSRQKQEMLYVLDCFHHMNDKGRGLVVLAAGCLYRSGTEARVRKQLIEENAIETVVHTPARMLAGAGTTVDMLVLNKNKKDNKVLFIDASDIFTKTGNRKYLSPDDVDEIIELVNTRENAPKSYLATPEEIEENNYNLSVSMYVEDEDDEEDTIADIKLFECTLNGIIDRTQELRDSINKTIEEIEELK